MRLTSVAIAFLTIPLLAQTEPPKTWIDPDTGHRVVRLTDEPGSATLYFNQNWFTPDNKRLVYSSRTGIYTMDLATHETKRVVEAGARLVEATVLEKIDRPFRLVRPVRRRDARTGVDQNQRSRMQNRVHRPVRQTNQPITVMVRFRTV